MVSLMKIEKGKRAETIHESIDEVMAAHNKQDQDVISCKKGIHSKINTTHSKAVRIAASRWCSSLMMKRHCYYRPCCQKRIPPSARKYVTALLRSLSFSRVQVLSYLKEQAKYDTATIFDFWRLPKEQSACVFLKDDLCSVYAKRPAGCRTLQVTSDPQKCSKSESLHQGMHAVNAADFRRLLIG